MCRDLLSSRWFQAGLAFFVLCVGGSLFYSWHVRRTTETELAQHDRFLMGLENKNETRPAESVNVPTDTEAPGFVNTPDENIDTPEAEDPSIALVDDAENVGLADVSSTRKTVQTSSNPLFADGVPEHLQCPENLIGVYARGLPTEELLKIYNIQQEVMSSYNPNRPIAEVWPQFIEAERGYHANADPMQRMLGTSAGRLDWSVQIILDFPEVLVIAEEDPERYSDMRMVDIGECPPDWNLHTLPDGREFRTATGYWYEFSLTSEDRLAGKTRGIGHSGRDAQLVQINLNEASDEELKRLEGWNYNINPYTTGIYKISRASGGMVLIPAGEFHMGSDSDEAMDGERPAHTVYIDAFYIDKHEVTNAQYKKFVDANPHWQKDSIQDVYHNDDYLGSWKGNNYPKGKADHPVVFISWHAAMAYADWAGKRLPTEAEWEKAARGGRIDQKYPWGDSIDIRKTNYGGVVGTTTPVGTYPPNAYGVFDMAGNVKEWCLDKFEIEFYKISPSHNPVSGENVMDLTHTRGSRVLRGGSWSSPARSSLVFHRFDSAPSRAFSNDGFRCVKAVSPFRLNPGQ